LCVEIDGRYLYQMHCRHTNDKIISQQKSFLFDQNEWDKEFSSRELSFDI